VKRPHTQTLGRKVTGIDRFPVYYSAFSLNKWSMWCALLKASLNTKLPRQLLYFFKRPSFYFKVITIFSISTPQADLLRAAKHCNLAESSRRFGKLSISISFVSHELRRVYSSPPGYKPRAWWSYRLDHIQVLVQNHKIPIPLTSMWTNITFSFVLLTA